MGSGLRAGKLGYLVFLARNGVIKGRSAQAILALAVKHMERLTDESFIARSNHAFFQLHGLKALVEALPDAPDAGSARQYVAAQFKTLMLDQFGRENMHLEHSPGYHLFGIRTLRKLSDSGWYRDVPAIGAALEEARVNLAWLVMPDGQVSRAGDSGRSKIKHTYARRLRSGALGRLFKEAGYAVVLGPGRRPPNSAMLFVTAGHHSRTHKHADDLSFELYDKGRFWIVDTGKFSYSKKDWREFTDSARAHNTVVYSPASRDNGLSLTSPVGGMLHHLEQQGESWIIDGRVERPAVGTVHERRFIYEPGVFLTLEDVLTFEGAREAVAWLHLASGVRAEMTGTGWRMPGAEIIYEIAGSAIPLEDALVHARGQEQPEIQGWVAQGYHKITPNDALGLRVHGDAIRITTTLRFT